MVGNLSADFCLLIAVRNRYMLINWMVNTWSYRWIQSHSLHIGIKLHCWQCATCFWSLNGGLKFYKILQCFCYLSQGTSGLNDKNFVGFFWLFSVLSHQSWIKNFFLSLDRTLSHGFKVPWFRLVCTNVEFVLSIVIKSDVNYFICTNVEFVLSIVIKWFKF